MESSLWNLNLIGPVVLENMLENVDGQTNDGRQSDWYTSSSPWSLQLMWAKTQHISYSIKCARTQENFTGFRSSKTETSLLR